MRKFFVLITAITLCQLNIAKAQKLTKNKEPFEVFYKRLTLLIWLNQNSL